MHLYKKVIMTRFHIYIFCVFDKCLVLANFQIKICTMMKLFAKFAPHVAVSVYTLVVAEFPTSLR